MMLDDLINMCPNKEFQELERLTSLACDLLHPLNRLVRDRWYRGKVYPRSAVGLEMVDFVLNSSRWSTFVFENDRNYPEEDARRKVIALLLSRMVQLGLVQHVTQDQDFIDGYYFYNFFPSSQP